MALFIWLIANVHTLQGTDVAVPLLFITFLGDGVNTAKQVQVKQRQFESHDKAVLFRPSDVPFS